MNPNVGVGVYEGEARRLYTAGLFAATLSYNPSKSLNFFVDTGVHTPETRHDHTAVIVDIGMGWLIDRDLHFDFSAGSRVRRRDIATAVSGGRHQPVLLNAAQRVAGRVGGHISGRLPSAVKAQRASCAP